MRFLTNCPKWIVNLYLFLMAAVFPLYFQDKYYNMGDAKYSFFKYASLAMLLLLAAAETARLSAGRGTSPAPGQKPGGKTRLFAADLAAAAYGTAALISWLLSPYRSESWIGSDEWYMGLLSQLLFVGIYFAVSRLGSIRRWLAWAAGTSGGLVFLLAYLHRFSIDPLGMYEGLSAYYQVLFLGTIGQATWYSSYICVILPVIMGIYFSRPKASTPTERLELAAAGGLVFLGFATAVTQNSDSVYIGLGLALLFFFWFALESIAGWKRFLELLLLGCAAAKITGLLQAAFPERVPGLEPLSLYITQSQAGWYILAVLILLYLAALAFCRKKQDGFSFPAIEVKKNPALQDSPPAADRFSDIFSSAAVRSCEASFFIGNAVSYEKRKWICRLRLFFYLFLLLALLSLPLLMWLITTGRLTAGTGLWQETGYLVFDNSWGNGRGMTWRYAAKILQEFPLSMKLFGCGPDAMTFYSETWHPEEIQAMWGGLSLTNAHNEWLTALIDYGIIGAAAYLSVFLCTLADILRHWRRSPVILAFGAAILAYMGHNIFCYQQTVCTPLIFIVMAAARKYAGSLPFPAECPAHDET